MTKELLDAVIHARKQQHQIKHAISELTGKVVELYNERTLPSDDYTDDEYLDQIGAFVAQEQASAVEAKRIFNLPKEEGVPVAHWSLKFNKMPDILGNLLPTIKGLLLPSEDSARYEMDFGGALPVFGYDDAWKTEGYKSAFWGTSTPTYLVAAGTMAYLCLTEQSISAFSLQSPIHHVVPFGNFDASEVPEESRLLYDVNGIEGYGFVHSGFAFGGSRFQENLYPEGKEWQPDDTSSYLKKWTLHKDVPNWANIGFSTADLLCVKLTQSQLSVMDQHRIPVEWAKSADGTLPEHFSYIDGCTDLRPGDIYVRKGGFSLKNPLGAYGDSGIVTEIRGDKIDVLTANRDMPYMEGVGIRTVSRVAKQLASNEEVFFLRPNAATPLQEDFAMEEVIRSVDQDMLDHMEEYVSVFAGEAASQVDE